MRKKIEILLSIYNGERYLTEQIDSLLAQENQDWFLTIRDDGSTDGSMEIIESYKIRYPELINIYYDNYGNLGSTLSFSKLIEQSNGDYIMLCDQDDVWLSDKISTTYEFLAKKEAMYPDIPLMVFTDLIEVDESLKTLNDSFLESQKLDVNVISNTTKLLALNVIAGCTTMMNSLCKKYVCPIPTKEVIHDQWIGVNVSHFGKVFFLNRQTILYRQHSSNVLGAKNVGFEYFFKKLSKPKKQFGIYSAFFKFISFPVSVTGFFYYKFLFSIRRIFP